MDPNSSSKQDSGPESAGKTIPTANLKANKYATNGSALVLAILICSLAYIYDPKLRLINYSLCLLGATLGWPAGIIASPLSTIEVAAFGPISKAIGVFISGYLLSKIDRLIEQSLYDKAAIVPSGWFSLVLFVCSFVVVCTVVFLNRFYELRPALLV